MNSDDNFSGFTGYTGGLLETNAWLLEKNGAYVLVDAPTGAAAWLAKKNIVPLALLMTHHHFDHSIGAADVVDLFGCPVYAYSQCSPDLTLEFHFKGFAGTNFAVRPFRVDHELKGLESIAIGPWNFELLHVPGHSPDSLCFFWREKGVLAAGDTLFLDSVGRPDFPGGDWELLKEGIQTKLFPLGDEVNVLPGHGPATTIGRERLMNPFVGEAPVGRG
jgi:hydroxyacylglutathione hydrolase